MSIRETCKKYREGGLVVMGIQTPEFEFEQNLDSVRREVTAREIDWPVAVGLLDDDRLYQFIRQPGSVQGRTFAIAFQEPGVEAYVFTSG